VIALRMAVSLAHFAHHCSPPHAPSISVSLPQALAASLDTAVRAGDGYFNTLVRILTTRCMTPAQYFGSGDQGVYAVGEAVLLCAF
jgi:hypothetical protein